MIDVTSGGWRRHKQNPICVLSFSSPRIVEKEDKLFPKEEVANQNRKKNFSFHLHG